MSRANYIKLRQRKKNVTQSQKYMFNLINNNFYFKKFTTNWKQEKKIDATYCIAT